MLAVGQGQEVEPGDRKGSLVTQTAAGAVGGEVTGQESVDCKLTPHVTC